MRSTCDLTRRALLMSGAALCVGRAAAEAESPALQALRRDIDTGFADVHSVVVLRGGRMRFEYQRNGDPDTLHDVQSVAKSGLSALVGIALAQGRIASLDQPVVALMPELANVNTDPRAAEVTVRHLLTMTAGFDADAAVTERADLARAAMLRPFKAAPGERFAYDNLGYALLGSVVQAAVGEPLAGWAEAQLMQPLGVARVQWPDAGTGRLVLGMRTRDMAALGQLFLQGGLWGDGQLVPADYVRAATQRQNAGGPPVGFDYGYMWWVLPARKGSPERRIFTASGYGGQLIWVNPAQAIVVAMTSDVSGASQARGQSIELLGGPLLTALPAV